MDASSLTAQIDDLADEVSSAGEGKTNWKALWASIKAIGRSFKEVRFSTRDARQEAWDRFQSIVDTLKRKQEAHFENRNHRQQDTGSGLAPGDLFNMVVRLERELSDAGTGKTDWKEHWASIRAVRDAFKGVRFSTREGRQETWDRFQSAVTNFKAKQDRYFQERRSDAEASRHHLGEVRSRANFDHVSDGMILLDILAGPSTMIAKIPMDALFGQSDEEKERLQLYARRMKGAWSYFQSHKDDLRGPDRGAAYSALREAQERLDDMWANWKNERQRIFDESQAKRKARSEEWRARQESYIERLEGACERIERKLRNREAHIDDLRDKYESARSSEYRERVSAWLSEAKAERDALRQQLEEVEGKLAEARGRL